MTRHLFELVEKSVASGPERTAILTPEREGISYRRLGEIVDGYVARASRAGIAPGDRVAMHAVSMTQFICLVFALSKLGCIFVRAPDESDGPGAVTADRVIVDGRSGLSGPNVIPMDLSWPAAGEAADAAGFDGFDTEDTVSLVLSSSGTTGRPKHLGFSLRIFKEKLDAKIGFSGPHPDRTLVHIPPTTVYGLLLAVTTLASGGTVVMPGPTHAETLSLLVDGEVDEIIAPPAIYAPWVEALKERNIRLNTVKRLTIGGSIASPALLQSVQEFICRDLFSHYGSSELGGVARAHVDEIAGLDGAVGKLAPWIDVRVTDDDGNPLPMGATGRLEFRLNPPHRVVPYFGSEPEEWFLPGDSGAVTEDGFLCIRARSGDLINVGGSKIAPSIIEEAVCRCLGEATTVCALGVPVPNGFDEVVVVIGTKYRARLADLPAKMDGQGLGLGRVHYLAIKSFPLNDFGKVERQKLQQMVTAEIARQRASRGR